MMSTSDYIFMSSDTVTVGERQYQTHVTQDMGGPIISENGYHSDTA